MTRKHGFGPSVELWTEARLEQSSMSSSPSISPPSSERAAAAVEAWLGGVAVTSRRAYRSDLRALARFVGIDQDEGEVEAARLLLSSSKGPVRVLLERWVAEGDGSPRYRLRRLGAVRSFLRFCHDTELGGPGVVVVRHSVHAPPPGRDAPSPLLIAETLRKLDRGEDLRSLRNCALLGVLASTFVRRAELAGMLREDFNLSGRTVDVRRKGGAVTRLRLPLLAVQRVERWLRAAPWAPSSPGPIWAALSKNGASVTKRGISGSTVYQTCREYGLPAPHSWRHLGAQWALEQGRGEGKPASVSELQALLGHRGTTATVHYVSRSTDNAAELRERWSRYLDELGGEL